MLDDCWDFNKRFLPRQNTTNEPPISSTMSIPRSDRMDEDSEEGSRFSWYDRPRCNKVEIAKVTEHTVVEFHQRVVMLPVEKIRVIQTPLAIVTTPTTHLSIRAKSFVVVRTTGMKQGRQV